MQSAALIMPAAPRRRRAGIYSTDGTRPVTVAKRVRLKPFILLAVAAALLIPFVIMNSVRTDTGLAEWWTRYIARGWEIAIGTLTSAVGFSVFELLLTSLIIVGVWLFVRLVIDLCRARFARIITGLCAIAIAAVYVLDLYMMSMGFGYYRAQMPFVSAGSDYNGTQVEMAVRYFLDDYNALAQKLERDENGCVICPYAFRDLSKLMCDEYARLGDDYFAGYTPIAKPVLSSWLLSDLLITGITFLPTAEASLNVAAPPTTVTYTLAHELAHTKGVQREGEANLISQYILLSSDNDYLRYCGYYCTFYSMATALVLVDKDREYADIMRAVSPLIVTERKYASEYWASQPDIIGQIGEFFNNIYLMFNGVENGTGSYNDGNQSSTVTPTDPETGDPVIDPGTEKPVVIPIYSAVQKMYFYLYEQACGAPPAELVTETE